MGGGGGQISWGWGWGAVFVEGGAVFQGGRFPGGGFLEGSFQGAVFLIPDRRDSRGDESEGRGRKRNRN